MRTAIWREFIDPLPYAHDLPNDAPRLFRHREVVAEREGMLEAVVQVGISRSGRGRYSRIALLGEVVRQTAEGFAVEWLQFSPDVVRIVLDSQGRGYRAARDSSCVTLGAG